MLSFTTELGNLPGNLLTGHHYYAQVPMHQSSEYGNITPDCGRKITFDNIDYHQNVHHMSKDYQNIDKHYVTYMSTKNRVYGNHLNGQPRLDGIEEMGNGKCIPSTNDNEKQRLNSIVWMKLVIITNIPYLNFLSDTCSIHIPHKYSAEMPVEITKCCIKDRSLFKHLYDDTEFFYWSVTLYF